jgi:hypothetical protein
MVIVNLPKNVERSYEQLGSAKSVHMMVSAWWAIGVFLLGAYAGTLVFALMSVAAREHAQGVTEEEAVGPRRPGTHKTGG